MKLSNEAINELKKNEGMRGRDIMKNTNFDEIEEIKNLLARIERYEKRIKEEEETTIKEMMFYSNEMRKEKDEKAKLMDKEYMWDSMSFGVKRVEKYKARIKSAINELGNMDYIAELDEETQAKVKHYAKLADL
jgi:hypothetical protein